MGGARCSYRTCTVKSDKKTHMFHFPVFDKIRCHQWITNAQKLNYLDLKLSQLKNRVICEHHFTSDSFMNVMRAKLKNTAVPTLDGPFCQNATIEPDHREIPINLDDIENDYLTNIDKRAHFSVKYGDFLTNDVTEPITLLPNYKSPSIRLQGKGETFNRTHINYNLCSPHNLVLTYNSVNDITPAKNTNNEKQALSDASTLFQNKLLPNPKVMAIEYEDFNPITKERDNETSQTVIPHEQGLDQSKTKTNIKTEQNCTPKQKSRKVKIISEKKISEPLRVNKSELQTVSPSILLKAPDKKTKPNVEINGTEIQTYYLDLTNPQPIDCNNMQGFNNSSIISTQPTVTDQMCFNEYPPSARVGDQIDFSNQNIEVLVESGKQTDSYTAEVSDRKLLKQEVELLNDLQNISMVPSECLPSSSSNAPCIFTLSTDVPEDSTLLTSSSYVHNISTIPTNVQTTTMLTDSETVSGLSETSKQASSVTNKTHIDCGVSKKTRNNLNKKMSTLPILSPNKMKSKMPAEKLAAIEEKRKYNMKLRDIINSCLNNLDDEPDAAKFSAAMRKTMNDKKVGEHLSKEPKLPSSQENIIAYLDARLQRMEDTLLNKIEQNTQRVADLKKIIKPSSGKRSAFTQTALKSGDTTKRDLYQQISRYLRPETNSAIYEQLFLNEYRAEMLTNSKPSTPQKRRRKI